MIGASYNDHYVMGDFRGAESRPDSPRAAIHLNSNGVVESFPLGDGRRRWVARVDEPLNNSTHSARHNSLLRQVQERASVDLSKHTCTMTSAFTAERFEAQAFAAGRVFLAGDAAHIISPIGGQGMNLGWLDAQLLAGLLVPADGRTLQPESIRTAYEPDRRRSFRRAARRAELNMWMGRSGWLYPVRSLMARLILSKLLRGYFVRLFTMQDL